MSVDLNTVKVAKTVDARGTACPGPLLEAKRAMAEVPMGGILEVMSSDMGTSEDIPLWAKKVGHAFLGSLEEAGYWRLFVKRGK
jgi:tRNA 2-thiouridine synthesizing protein A